MEITLTDALIRAGANGPAGWSAKQMAILGVPWPQPKGWLRALIGTTVSQETYRAFIAARKGPADKAHERAQARLRAIRKHLGNAVSEAEALAHIGAGTELRDLGEYVGRLVEELGL
jgi:hypothetical protein